MGYVNLEFEYTAAQAFLVLRCTGEVIAPHGGYINSMLSLLEINEKVGDYRSGSPELSSGEPSGAPEPSSLRNINSPGLWRGAC